MEKLPADLLLKIFSFLERKDLCQIAITCHYLKSVSEDSSLWRKLCGRTWLVVIDEASSPEPSEIDIEIGSAIECAKQRDWKEVYRCHFIDFGRYEDCYRVIKEAWDIIEDVTRQNCYETLYTSLEDGVSDEDLDKAEKSLDGLCLPNDLKCSLRIHNGQNFSECGLLGSVHIGGHYDTEYLLALNLIINGISARPGLQGCVPLSFCATSRSSQFIRLSDAEENTKGQIFWPNVDHDSESPTPGAMHAFVQAYSFTEWFTGYAKKLQESKHVFLNNEIFRYSHDSSMEAVTHGIKVTTSTMFVPSMSMVSPPKFFFTYFITISMDESESKQNSCQLTTRHWYITDGNGTQEEVHGDGVVGKFPVMKPGRIHKYESCTSFSTPTGTMDGYYVFKYLNKTREVSVTIPTMKFKALLIKHCIGSVIT